jgi:hypothetical protein
MRSEPEQMKAYLKTWADARRTPPNWDFLTPDEINIWYDRLQGTSRT